MALFYTHIEDDLETIVANVSTAILPQLQIAQPSITGVYFQFGTILELIETLTQLGKTATGKFKKYPLVFLFVDVKELRGNVGNYTDLKLRIAIINHTSPTFKAKERLEQNFKPILEPIYHELMRQITLSGNMFIGASSLDSIRHTATRRYYWGREGEGGNTANKFSDWVDGIDIENLELKYYLTRC